MSEPEPRPSLRSRLKLRRRSRENYANGWDVAFGHRRSRVAAPLGVGEGAPLLALCRVRTRHDRRRRALHGGVFYTHPLW
jgi:hypothetical protein